MTDEQNVLGMELEPCSEDPVTGYLRDGCCHHLEAEVAPPVVLEATHEAVLDEVHFSTLNEHEYDGER